VKRTSKEWLNIFRYVVESKKPYHLLIFEDLVKDPVKEIKKVLQFLEEASGLKVENQDERLLCLSENLQGTDKRTKRANQTDPFTLKLKIYINNIIDSAQTFVSRSNLSANLSVYKRKITSNRGV